MSPWTNPPVLISVATALIGAAVGGACSVLAASVQVRKQFEQQRRERREAISRQMEGLRVFLKAAKTPAQCTEVAFALRRFFMENPERLSESENREFFNKYLATLCERTPPSDAYWTVLRSLGFLTDEDQLKS
jgi:hypothetical protein